MLTIGKGALAAMLIVTAALAGASIVARSSLLMAAAVLALGACLGARAGYWHATYMLAIYEPLVTIVLFSLLALGTYYLSKSLAADYERLALIAARTSVFMVNFGFWIGSLWGDNLLLIRSLLRGDPSILTNYSAGSQIFRLWPLSSAGRLCCLAPASGAFGEQALGGQCRRSVRGHPFLHAVVREARSGAAISPCRRSSDARLRAGTMDIQ